MGAKKMKKFINGKKSEIMSCIRAESVIDYHLRTVEGPAEMMADLQRNAK